MTSRILPHVGDNILDFAHRTLDFYDVMLKLGFCLIDPKDWHEIENANRIIAMFKKGREQCHE